MWSTNRPSRYGSSNGNSTKHQPEPEFPCLDYRDTIEVCSMDYRNTIEVCSMDYRDTIEVCSMEDGSVWRMAQYGGSLTFHSNRFELIISNRDILC